MYLCRLLRPGRELTAVILPEKEVVQIKARKIYVVPESD